MEKRVLLAITLSFLVLAAYQYLFVKPPQPRPAPVTTGAEGAPGPQQQQAPAPPGDATAQRPSGAVTGLSAQAPTPAPVAVESIVGDSEEREIVVEGEYIRAVFTNRGAQLLEAEAVSRRTTVNASTSCRQALRRRCRGRSPSAPRRRRCRRASTTRCTA
jgi:YidC/Oxa1 family membrane protein insertase